MRVGSVFQRTQKEYARRINAALQFIDEHLGEEIPLARLSVIASFSPFHFHRLFSALVGEAPAEFIRRLRLEKAASLLVNDPSRTVTEIALSCGFATSALFARLFKARFAMTPTAWRDGGYENRKNGQAIRKIGNEGASPPEYSFSRAATSQSRRRHMKKAPEVRVQEIPSFRVAYVKHMKGYEEGAGIEKAFQTLFYWAGPRGFLSPDMRVLGISFDNPEVTPKDKCRYYACVAVDERAEPEGEVGVMTVRSGKYAVARFAGSETVFKDAYAYMYGEWLPTSGFQPDDAPALESYIGEPSKKGFVFDLHIPVKPL
jgi:AraC family transcriptional regulator